MLAVGLSDRTTALRPSAGSMLRRVVPCTPRPVAGMVATSYGQCTRTLQLGIVAYSGVVDLQYVGSWCMHSGSCCGHCKAWPKGPAQSTTGGPSESSGSCCSGALQLVHALGFLVHILWDPAQAQCRFVSAQAAPRPQGPRLNAAQRTDRSTTPCTREVIETAKSC